MKVALAVAAATLALVGSAHAGVVVEGAIASISAEDNTPSVLNTFGELLGPHDEAIASPNLSVSASDSIVVNSLGQVTGAGAGSASIEYFYTVIGPVDVQVPLIIAGSLSASVSGGPSSTAQASISGAFGKAFVCATSPLLAGCNLPDSTVARFPSVLNLDVGFTVTSDTQQDVVLDAVAGANPSLAFVSAGAADADPTITIDPTFLANNPGFSLAFSPNIEQPTPTSSVPEPASIALFGMGLVGLGVIRRQRRRAV